jgi:NADH pyrophosphatase NudC (nudix superfamily)
VAVVDTMTDKVLIAQAFGAVSDQGTLLPWAHHSDNCEGGFRAPVLIVHGLPESELRELIERRGVCEQLWEVDEDDGHRYLQAKCKGSYQWPMAYRFCPSCGSKVEVSND